MTHQNKTVDLVTKAISFAAERHAQAEKPYRKGTNIPYIFHPVNAGKILSELGAPDNLVVAAILHDLLEDTETTLGEIDQNFGAEVAELVQNVSEPEHGKKAWRERKQHTIERLKTAEPDVLKVACADKIDNIQAIRRDYEQIGEELWKRFNASKEDQSWYYQTLSDIFTERGDDEISRALSARFAEEVNKTN